MAVEKCAGAITGCELCGGAAAVHCAADSAFLCAACDAKVHGANFLASRHVRRRLVLVDDAGHCHSEHGSATDSDASSSCVSTADSCAAAPRAMMKGRGMGGGRKSKKERARAEEVLEGWAKRMGLARGVARRRAARAARALRALGRSRVPLRVAMAAALWSEVAAEGCGEAALLRRLEASAHVPARMVVAVAAWMARAAGRAAAPVEEGWAECS